MSDLLGAAVVLWCLVLVGRCGEDREIGQDGGRRLTPTWRAALGGALAAAGYLVKTVAMPLAGAVPLWLLWRRRLRPAVVFAAVFLPVMVAWTVWVRTHTIQTTDLTLTYYTSYINYHLRMIAGGHQPIFIWHNAWYLAAAVGDLVYRGMSENPLGAMGARILAVLAIAGIVRLARRRGLDAYHLYALATGAIFLIWHFPTTVRFLFPVAPLILAGIYGELRNLARVLVKTFRKPALGERILAGTIGAAIVAAAPIALKHHLDTDLFGFPAIFDQVRTVKTDREKVNAWIADHVPDNAAIYAYDDAILHLDTGRQAIKVSLPTRAVYLNRPDEFLEPFREFDQFLRRHKLHYALVCESDFIGDMPENLRPTARDLIRQTPGLTQVYASDLCTLHRYTK